MEEKFNQQVRKNLLKLKLDSNKVKELFGKGLSIWEVCESVYNFKFQHSNRKTWIFYQKVNNIRHSSGIQTHQIKISPLTTLSINTFLEKHTEEELRSLLVRGLN